ncbi:IclR family transcriptional regulator [Cloacibacillus porcorum]|uniref:IclR family transcriptional regulator n=1 Tax=Cloacibacillus porcorum TaxID=1197717 RepID=A0A1B2I1W3_9BACT|nr:IclR family transcriptional regulator [Cloacibacillus porcorum]ANZ43971.1 hypothetical protein BED41_01995 [Cloacibacillus porcorum]MCD8233307.1 IclR family transcriptional regulator [Cloacibacillus porcorum]
MSLPSKVMALVEVLLETDDNIGIRELALRTNISKSTVQRILDSLEENGWVTQDAKTLNYRIGFKLLSMTNSWRLRLELTRHSHDEMVRLCEESRQTVLLLVQDGYRGICLDKVEPERTIKLVAEMGKVFPLHAAACGKILLAYAQPSLQNHILESTLETYTPLTITDSKALKLEIERIRAEGKAISVEEMTYGAAEIAVPLFNSDGSLIAALSIAGPKFDVEPKLTSLESLLRLSADNIVKQLINDRKNNCD